MVYENKCFNTTMLHGSSLYMHTSNHNRHEQRILIVTRKTELMILPHCNSMYERTASTKTAAMKLQDVQTTIP